MIEFIPKRAQKPDQFAIDNSDGRPEIFRYPSDLLSRKLRREKPFFPLLFRKICNEVF